MQTKGRARVQSLGTAADTAAWVTEADLLTLYRVA